MMFKTDMVVWELLIQESVILSLSQRLERSKSMKILAN